MKVIYKSVKEKLDELIEQHINEEENEIKYFLLTEDEFKELLWEKELSPKIDENTIILSSRIVNDLFEKTGRPQRATIYSKHGVDWLIVQENNK